MIRSILCILVVEIHFLVEPDCSMLLIQNLSFGPSLSLLNPAHNINTVLLMFILIQNFVSLYEFDISPLH
jgi:hypothetical protein